MVFHPFDRQHLITLGVLVLAGALIVRAARRGSASQRAWQGRLLGFVLLSYVVVVYTQKAIAGDLSWQNALPLELCHVVMFACVISLIRPVPLLSEIAYFWGAAGTLQATLTPEIGQGFPSWEFVLFFWSHGGILLAIVFFVASRDFQPRPGSVLRMCLAINLYALVIGGIDAATGWNYGYLCQKPSQPSLLDYMGPWPWYLVTAEGVALVSFWILDLPWKLATTEGTGKTEKDSSRSL